MTRDRYHALLDQAMRHRPLPGPQFRGVGFGAEHHWKVTAERELGGLWRIFVGAGTVNDQIAAITYRTSGDARGWIMPDDYPPFAPLAAVFGNDYAFVDRPLWETPAPFLQLTPPGADGIDTGGFVKVADASRPEFFRTEEMWERDLYRAGVFVSISPYRSDPTQAALRTGGARATRWRVFAGRAPNTVADAGVAALGSHELARVYLLRTPGKPEEDEIHIDQRCYWSLRAQAILNLPLLALIGVTAEAMAGLDIGLLALGLTGVTVGTAMLGLQAALVDLLLANLEAIVAATSRVRFWSA